MRELRHISEYESVDFVYPLDPFDVLGANIGFISSKLGRLLKGGAAPLQGAPPRRRVRVGRDVDVIYSHRAELPTPLRATPFVWFHSVADPAMMKANGAGEKEIEADYQRQAHGYRSATKVQMTSDAEVARHREKFPELADKFVRAPWFRPGLSAASLEYVRAKHADDGRLRLAFVGRQARRKGLDIVLDALRMMSDVEREAMRFDVVTTFGDGPIDCSANMDLRVHREIDDRSLDDILNKTHVYVMPCRFETFGLVFVEAMSHGCAVIAPNWEVQREIFDNGRAGVNVATTPEAVCAALRSLRGARDRLMLAEAAIERFETRYGPAAVARAYRSLFEQAADSAR
ncbi:glycosyltransferase family 4 protein [Methylosinus sp. Sm6]|uniref:glycosyltransferase family 4 protein n=1 Tax=Methylosinus sp. Sm6 TaxID=2866948 RepID=UPI001C994C8C|nr:glycosyltransferase family 4 protein [Methylosinus sp. Sm6]MBY6243407.1 glycosyltransferase family 4 protein [Methylosinus sp. Sm6]